MHAGSRRPGGPRALRGRRPRAADAVAVLTEVGRNAVAVPALATLALGVLPVVALGHAGAAGRALLARRGRAAPSSPPRCTSRRRPLTATPRTAARRTAGGFVVSGVKIGVPYAAGPTGSWCRRRSTPGTACSSSTRTATASRSPPSPTSSDAAREFRLVLDGRAGRRLGPAARRRGGPRRPAPARRRRGRGARRRRCSPARSPSPPRTSRTRRAVRPAARHVPGRGAADRRRLRRRPHAAPRGARRRRRGRAARRPAGDAVADLEVAAVLARRARRRAAVPPATTCTAGSASTSATRCTGTPAAATDLAHARRRRARHGALAARLFRGSGA